MQNRDDLAEYRFKMYKIVIPVFVLICGLALLLNLLVIAALRRTRISNTGVSLILSLTFSDMWTSSIVASSLLYNSYLPAVQGTSVNPCFSLTLEILRTSGLLTGTFHLLLIAINHYISIVQPHINKESLRRIAFSLCIFAWSFPIFTLLLLSLSYEDQGYYNCLRVEFYHSRIFRTTISGLLLAIFIIIILLYIKLLHILRKQTSKLRSKSSQTRVYRILWTAILMCSSYFIGWSPAAIVFSLTCASCDLLREQRFRTIFYLSSLQLSFILAKSIFQPLIYAIRNPEVSLQIRTMLSKCTSRFNGLFVSKSSNSNSKDGSTGINNLAPENRLLEEPTWDVKSDMAPLNDKKKSSPEHKNTIVRM